jgi:hypothetical protein
MSQESAAQLVNFVRGAFGARCADLLLVGLGEEPVQGAKKFDVPEAEEGKAWELEVEVVGGALPCHSEPLVLAALLKILLGRGGVPYPLEFQMSEVMEELRRVSVTLTDEDVGRIISKYAALSYDKRAKGEGESGEGSGGVYSLIAGYIRDSKKEAGETSRALASSSVHFEQSFAAGLRQGQVIVAGIRFGKLGNLRDES